MEFKKKELLEINITKDTLCAVEKREADIVIVTIRDNLNNVDLVFNTEDFTYFKDSLVRFSYKQHRQYMKEKNKKKKNE